MTRPVQFIEKLQLLCRRHTLPMLTPDGHTNKEIFTFGPDRVSIGSFARTSSGIVWSSVQLLRLRQQHREWIKNLGQIRTCSYSCWLRVSILPFVKPSWGHLEQSCRHRVYLVYSSESSGNFRHTKAMRRKQEGIRCSYEGNPNSQCLRVAIVLYYECINNRLWAPPNSGSPIFPNASW